MNQSTNYLLLCPILTLMCACTGDQAIALEFEPPANQGDWQDCGSLPGVESVIATPSDPVAGVSFQLSADATDSEIEATLDCLETADVERSSIVVRRE